MIKIWGSKNSINVQKVLWCCDELDIPYQRIDTTSLPGDVDAPAYLGLNPNGLVPTIEDGDFVLWESNAILRYLAAKYDSDSIWLTNLEARALADQWMDWFTSTLWRHMRPIFIQLVRCPADKRDQLVIDEASKNTLKALKILDDHLKANRYMTGGEFTIGDIPVGVAAYRWMSLPIKRQAMPHFESWYARLSERQAYRQHVMLPLS